MKFIEREKAGPQKHFVSDVEEDIIVNDVFFEAIGFKIPKTQSTTALQTIEDLLDRDEQRAKDGFPRRIKLGKIVKPGKKQAGCRGCSNYNRT